MAKKTTRKSKDPRTGIKIKEVMEEYSDGEVVSLGHQTANMVVVKTKTHHDVWKNKPRAGWVRTTHMPIGGGNGPATTTKPTDAGGDKEPIK